MRISHACRWAPSGPVKKPPFRNIEFPVCFYRLTLSTTTFFTPRVTSERQMMTTETEAIHIRIAATMSGVCLQSQHLLGSFQLPQRLLCGCVHCGMATTHDCSGQHVRLGYAAGGVDLSAAPALLIGVAR